MRSDRVKLDELVAAGHTALVTQECQGAVVGPDAGLRLLADEARRQAVPNIARLLPADRAAGVHVVHCLVQRRPDGLVLATITTTDDLLEAWH
jgi:biuret amidohydrolase